MFYSEETKQIRLSSAPEYPLYITENLIDVQDVTQPSDEYIRFDVVSYSLSSEVLSMLDDEQYLKFIVMDDDDDIYYKGVLHKDIDFGDVVDYFSDSTGATTLLIKTNGVWSQV